MTSGFDFSKLDKAQQKTRLAFEFGLLLQPFRELASRPTPPKQVEYIRTLALFDQSTWYAHAHIFALRMGKLEENLVHVFGMFVLDIGTEAAQPDADLVVLQQKLQRWLRDLEERFFKLIEIVPVDWEMELSEGDAPFTFYMRVLDATSTARRRLHYFDLYLKPEFFDLYLRNVDPNLEIRLVTEEGDRGHGVVAVRAVSNLARQEFSNYQLIQVTKADMHDRNLRIDDQVFTLGTSLVDAGRKPTHFGPVDTTASKVLDDLLAKGTVIHRS